MKKKIITQMPVFLHVKKELDDKSKEITNEKPRYTKKELDDKLKKITKESNKNLKELKKKKKEYEDSIKELEEKNKNLALKRSSIIDQYSTLEYEDGKNITETHKKIKLPPEIFGIVFKYCAQNQPVFFLVTRQTYKYFKELSSIYYINDVPPSPYTNLTQPNSDTLTKNVSKRVLDIITLLNNNNMLPWRNKNGPQLYISDFNFLYSKANDNEHDPEDDKKLTSKPKLRRYVFILDILLRSLLDILPLTIDFHKAAMKTSQPQVKLDNEKTIKWFLLQNVTCKNNKERHYFQSMNVILDEDGGHFNLSKIGFDGLGFLLNECFGISLNRLEYGTSQRKVPIKITFV